VRLIRSTSKHLFGVQSAGVTVTAIKGDAGVDFGDGAVDQANGLDAMSAFLGGRQLL